jgi:hypothetical protein
MKKNTRKLVLRGESIRALGTLDNIHLGQVVGGGDAADAAGTDRTQSGIDCPAQAAAFGGWA